VESFRFEPVGIMESCFTDKFGTPRQPGLVPAAKGFLRLNRKLQPEYALEGLKEFSHLWLVFVFHDLKEYQYRPKIHPPRLKGKSIGVFASRSPHRPNPIGLSLVQILEVSQEGLWLGGLDLVNGTPILDIKPYLPEVEAIPAAQSGWVDDVQASAAQEEIQVEWSKAAEVSIEAWQQQKHGVILRDLIEQTLKLDPRPLVYRGFEESDDSPYRQSHAVRIYEGDVHFRFTSKSRVEVTTVFWGSWSFSQPKNLFP